MTAPEPTRPADEHTDAVARAMNPPTFRAGPVDGPRASAQKVIRARAKSLLTSTDPAVHAAMLDALVRAGVLVRTTITANNATVSILAERIEVAP